MDTRVQAVAARRVGVTLAAVALAAGGCDLVRAGGEDPRADASAAEGPSDEAVPRPSPPIDREVMQAYLACLDVCFAGIHADRSTCRLACASSSLDEVPNLSAGAKTCMLPCLETLARCSLQCETTATPPEDAHACELECQSAASSCLSHCVETNE